MKKLILLTMLCSVILFSQEFKQSNLYHYDVICEDYTKLYAENPDVKQKIFYYGGLSPCFIDNDYIYYSSTFGVFRMATDGSRMDSLFAVDYDYKNGHWLFSMRFANDFFVIQDIKDNKCYSSFDKGENWEVLADFGPESNLRIGEVIDENNFLLYISGESHLLLITKDRLKTIDTIDVLDKSGSNFLKEFDSESGVGGFMGIGSGTYCGETSDEIFKFFRHPVYDEQKQDSIIKYQYYCVKTEDGGQNWTRYSINVKYETSTSDFYQFGDTLIIGGNRKLHNNSINSRRYGNIIISTDRGETWKNIIDEETFPQLQALSVWNPKHMAFSNNEEGYINWTRDGGKTWKYNKGEDLGGSFGPHIMHSDKNSGYMFLGTKIIKAELNAPTSVKESTLQKGMVYPNPAKQSLNIELSYVSLNSNFTISDIQGQRMQSGIFVGSDIDISGLAPGVYQITIESSETNYTEIFVKE